MSWPVKARQSSGTGARRGATDGQQPRVTEPALQGTALCSAWQAPQAQAARGGIWV